MSNKYFSSRICLGIAAILSTVALVTQANVPHGWKLRGSNPDEYDAGVDLDQTYQDHMSAFLKSKQLGHANGFGTLMQSLKAEQCLGKKVRLSGLVKSEDVLGWAGLWMRVDKETAQVAFDNMQNRPIKGTTGWQRYYVVLDVPRDATAVSFGILLVGPGEVWLNSTKFDVLDVNVPANTNGLLEKPVNLDFAE